MSSCSASGAATRPSASMAGDRRRSIAFSGRPRLARTRLALASKVTDVKIQRGQRVRLETPGGGGWGDPLARDPTLVARDLRLGYLTPEVARDQYRVIADDKGEVDLAATTILRAEHLP